MFCPNCKDEFRPGFARCASCDVDLVDDLDQLPPEPEAATAVQAEPSTLRRAPMADYCGFMDLSEARHARDRLRREGIGADILIRETPESTLDSVHEEYWLRVEAQHSRQATQLLESDAENS
jgi:hypothetical protein